MVSLDHTWRWITRWRGRGALPAEVISELLSSLCLLPLCVSDLRRGVSGKPSCTDASYGGGGACVGRTLTPSGCRRARRLRAPVEQRSGSEFGILSMFDCIGGARRACELLDMPVAMYVSIELDPRRRRVVKAHWPHAVHFEDVKQVGRGEIRKLRQQFPRIRVLLAGGGFPCRDMSRLRGPGRRGIQGVHSGLVVEIVRIWRLIEDEWPCVDLVKFAENVSSSLLRDVLSVNKLLGCLPVLVEAADVGWIRRGRYYWCGWPVSACASSSAVTRDHCLEVRFSLERPPCK